MPETGVVPCVKVKVVVVNVKGSIASVKNTPTLVLVGTSVAPLALMVPVTMGTVASGVVVGVGVGVSVGVGVGVGVVVVEVQADTSVMTSIMMIDRVSQSVVFLFI